MSEWHSIDILEEGVPVLMYQRVGDDHHYEVASLYVHRGLRFKESQDGTMWPLRETHWMRLPHQPNPGTEQ